MKGKIKLYGVLCSYPNKKNNDKKKKHLGIKTTKEVSAFPSLKRNSLTRKRLRRKWKREPISARTHFISLVIALPLPRVYKFLPWSAGACYYPVMTSGQLCEETKSLTSLLPVTGFLDNAPCEKDILKKPLSVKKAAGQEW